MYIEFYVLVDFEGCNQVLFFSTENFIENLNYSINWALFHGKRHGLRTTLENDVLGMIKYLDVCFI